MKSSEAAAAAAAVTQEEDGEQGEEDGPTLPLSKILTIMRCSPDIEQVATNSLTLVARATELFIQHFITQAYVHSRDKTVIEYAALAQAVDREDNLDFLADVLPRKRLASECVDFRKLKSAAVTPDDS